MSLAASRPAAALDAARRVLAGSPSLGDAAVAHQTLGFLLRDFGDTDASIGELRKALRLARRAGLEDLHADVLASLAVALVYTGRTSAGLAALDRALASSRGVMAARVLHRRGIAFWTLGRYPAALADLRRAVTGLRQAGDAIWTARALTARGLVYLAQGATVRADADFVAAGRWFAKTSQDLESIYTVHNRAKVAYRSGNLPTALAFLDRAGEHYQLLGGPMPELSIDRCNVLLAAGLPREALAEADNAAAELERSGGHATRRAELLLTAASSALADGDPHSALRRAKAARQLFRAQRRPWWHAHAQLVLLQAQHGAHGTSAQLLHAAVRAAAELDRLGSLEAPQAHLLAGRAAMDLRHDRTAERHLAAAAGSRWRGPALTRAVGWLAEALRADAAGDPTQVLNACRRGLDVLDAHRLTLGAMELRAQATAHGTELAALAQVHALSSRRPRSLLTWSERWRATALAVPRAYLPVPGDLAADLAALRDVTSRLGDARAEGSPTTLLEREQQRLERAARAKARHAPGARDAAPSPDVAGFLDLLGPARLIEIVEVDGIIHVLICTTRTVRRVEAGRLQDAVRAGQFARFALRRLARRRPGDDQESALAVLAAAGTALQEALLGPAAGHLGDESVVIVPPGRLHALPWALMPAMRGRAVSVAPSAQTWMRARTTSPPARRNVVVIRGPELAGSGAEVPGVAAGYADVTVLADGGATVGRVLSALDGAWLVHIAAHGTFRADSPMFSTLHLDDGPLTVYDLEHLRQAPHRMVIASCESAMLAPAGTDELLGLSASLLSLGTAGIIAAVVPLDDTAAVPVMLSLHEHLRSGLAPAEALRRLRLEPRSDPVERATALSLLAVGAD
jgi:tetratricopeptide (TPR) repeat protein